MATIMPLPRGHGMAVGDILRFTTGTRWQRLGQLLKKPRATYVTQATPTTVEIAERRMTWTEWRGELWAILREG